MNCKLKFWFFSRSGCHYKIKYIEEAEAILEWPPPRIGKTDNLHKTIDFIYTVLYALRYLSSELKEKKYFILY